MNNGLTNNALTLAPGQKLAYNRQLNHFLIVNANQPIDPNVTTKLSIISVKVDQFLSSNEHRQLDFKEKFFVSANINVLNQAYRRYNAKIESHFLLNLISRILSVFSSGMSLRYSYIKKGSRQGNHQNDYARFSMEEVNNLLNFARNNKNALPGLDLICAALPYINQITAENQNFVLELIDQIKPIENLWNSIRLRSSEQTLLHFYEYVLQLPIQGTPLPIRRQLFSYVLSSLVNLRLYAPNDIERIVLILAKEFELFEHGIQILRHPHLNEIVNCFAHLSLHAKGLFCEMFSNIRNLDEVVRTQSGTIITLYQFILESPVSDRLKPLHDRLFRSILSLFATNNAEDYSLFCSEMIAREYSYPEHRRELLNSPAMLCKVFSGKKLTPDLKKNFIAILNDVASNENHWNAFKHQILAATFDKRNIYLLYQHILSESNSAYLYTEIHKRLFSLLTSSYFTASAQINRLVIEEFSDCASHKDRLVQQYPALIVNAIRATISDATKQNLCIELFNGLNEISSDFWKELELQFGPDLDRLYQHILSKPFAANYNPTALHENLFLRFLKASPAENTVFAVISKEYAILEHREKLWNSPVGVIGLAIALMDAPHIFMGSEEDTKEFQELQIKVLQKLLISFIEKDVVSSSLLGRYIQVLEYNGIFQSLWEKVPIDSRIKLLQKVSKPPLSSYNRQICQAIYQFYKEQYSLLDSKQFVEQHQLEKEAFFDLALYLNKVPELPKGVLVEFTRYLAQPSTLQKLKKVENVNLKQFLDRYLATIETVQEIPPRFLISLLYNFREVLKSYSSMEECFRDLEGKLKSHSDKLYSFSVTYNVLTKSHSAAIREIYQRHFSGLNTEEKEVYFSLVLSESRLKEISLNHLDDFIKYLIKNNNQEKQVIDHIFYLLEDKSAKIPSLLILELLQRNHKKNGIHFDQYLEQMKDDQLKELIKCLENLDLIEVSGSEVDLSIAAVYVCSAAIKKHREKASEAVKSILSRINMSRIPKPLFKDKICPKAAVSSSNEIRELRDLITQEPDVYLCSGDEDLWIEYYTELEKNLKINASHLTVAQKADIVPPQLPPNVSVSYDELITMFNRINFTDPSAQGYVNPRSLEDDGDRVTQESLRVGITSFVDKVKRGPSYSPNNPQQREQWLKNLELWVKHSILLLRQRPDKDRSIYLIWLAGAGLHCGGKIYSTSQDLYSKLSGAQVFTEGEKLTNFLSTTLSRRRLHLLEKEFNSRAGGDPQSTHIWAHTMRHSGQPFGALGWKMYDYEDPIATQNQRRPLCSAASQNELFRVCMNQYNTTLIINELYGQLNGIGRSKGLGANREFRTNSIEAWFNGNFPLALKQKFLEERHKNVQLKDRIEGRKRAEKAYNEKEFKKLLAEEYQMKRQGDVVSCVARDLFFDDYFEQHPFADENQVVRAAFDRFKVADFSNIVFSKQQMLFEEESKSGTMQLMKERNKEIDAIYAQSLVESDEFNGAVLDEIYHVDYKGRMILKRKWLIYLLMHISLSENGQCSILQPTVTKLGTETIYAKQESERQRLEIINSTTQDSCPSSSSSNVYMTSRHDTFESGPNSSSGLSNSGLYE